MKPVFRTFLVAVAAELGTAPANAQPNIAIQRPDPGSCVDTAELTRTLASARIHAERADDAPPSGASTTPANAAGSAPLSPTPAPPHRKPRVSVTIAGTPEALRVTLHRHGSDTTELLSAATCASATDAVAAFLSSALGPPPNAPPPVALEALERAIGDELARRHVQLALLGMRLTLSRDTPGNVSAFLEHPRTPACTQNVVLGVIDEATPENVNDAADVLAQALLTARPCPEPPAPEPPPPPRPRDWAEPERARALSKALDRVQNPRARFALGTLEVTSGLTFAIVTVAASHASESPNAQLDWPFWAESTKAQRTLVGWGNGVLIGGGIGALTVGPDRGNDLGVATYFASHGLLLLGNFFGGSRFAQQATAVGSLMTAALAGVNVARPTPLARLAADQQEVLRQGLTRARARAIERDIEQADPFVPTWLVLAPVAAGSSVALIHTFATGDYAHSTLLVLDGIWAFGLGAAAAGYAVQGSIPGSYRQALRGLGLEELSLAPGPGEAGLSLVGRF